MKIEISNIYATHAYAKELIELRIKMNSLSMFLLLLLKYPIIILLSITTEVYSLQYDSHNYYVQDEQSTLLHLKQSLQFESDLALYSPSKLSTWNSSSDCCVWGGVTCSAAGHVIGLDLQGEGITGWGLFHNSCTSSPLFDLHHLQRQDLSWNSFNGTAIPSGIGKLANLLHLDLSGSEFGGQVPVEISSLTSLLTLNLSQNNSHDLKLENPKLSRLVQNLTRLTELKLDYVDLSAEADHQWCHALSSSLPSLQVLSLSDCSLPAGPLHTSLVKLQALSAIDLSNNNLSSPVPDFLCKFTNLTSLRLRACNLYGNFPHKMPATIQSLDLSDNQLLSGTLPEAIGNLKMMMHLDLSDCGISGSIGNIHWENLRNLTHLDLSGNSLIGSIPTSIFKLVGLEWLDISHNNFSGSIDLTYLLQHLVNLSYINLSFNSLSIVDNVSSASTIYSSLPHQLVIVNLASCNLKVFPDFLRNQSSLTILDLSDNQIDGLIPNWIWKPKLNHVNLSHNSLFGFQGSFPNLTSVWTLDLNSNQLRGQIPLPLSSARYLDLSNNNFNSEIPFDFANYLSPIIFLSLKSNNFHGGIPPSICNNLYEIVIDLSNNSLSGIIPPCLFDMDLGVLNLRGNKLSGNIPDAFQPTCSLQTLDLSDNQLQGNVPESMVHCKSLQVLNLGNNEINGGFPCWLMEISSLRVLVLRSNRFHGSVSCALGNATAATNSWSMLQIMDIAANDFGGELPHGSFKSWKAMMSQTLGDIVQPKFDLFGMYYQDKVTVHNKGLDMELVKILTVFNLIDFSCNNFQGSIPESIGDLKSLYALNLSHNHFKGQIPSSMGNLKEVESLDLAMNSLSGDIPVELANLNFLSFLNLSYNQLVGRIPTSTQLQSFSKFSYTGNKGLCGPPLEINCTSTNAPVDPTSANDGIKEIDWEVICAEIGYAVGLGTVVASLLLWKRWKLWYFALVDRLIFKIFPQLEQRSINHRRRRIQRRNGRQRQ